jgi:hypothetical protein
MNPDPGAVATLALLVRHIDQLRNRSQEAEQPAGGIVADD